MCVDVNGVVVGIIPAGGGAVDSVELTTSQPPAPAADKVKIFGRNMGGRMMPAFIGPSGLDSSLQPSLSRNCAVWAQPYGNGTAMDSIGITFSITGTATAANVGTANLHAAMKRVNYHVATASATAVAGVRVAALQYFRGNPGGKLGGFHFVCRFGPSIGNAANTTRRGFCGFTSLTTAPTDANPSGLPNVLGVGCDNTDSTYHIIYKTGTATATKVNTGIVKSAVDNTEVYELVMFCPPGGTSVHFEFTNLTTNVVFKHTATTSLPAATQLLAPSAYYSVGGTSSVIGLAFMRMYIETDF